jgi:hypothetical protein
LYGLRQREKVWCTREIKKVQSFSPGLYQELLTSLRSHWCQGDPHEEVLAKFHSTRKHPKESLLEFADRIEQNGTRANVNEDDIWYYFKIGTNNVIREHLKLYQITSLVDLRSRGRSIDKLISNTSTTTESKFIAVAQQDDPVQQGNKLSQQQQHNNRQQKFKRKEKVPPAPRHPCAICDTIGHFTYQCPQLSVARESVKGKLPEADQQSEN